MTEKVKQVLQQIFGFFLKTNLRMSLLAILVIAPAVMAYILFMQKHPSSFTVMITNMAETSGGSGSVIKSSKDQSIILTNSHVCHVLDKGGLVKKEDGTKFMAVGYKESYLHDLCLVYVAADLGATVKLASKEPELYSEATISGHPSLLPAIISGGKFGDRKVIDILVGFKPCTEKDFKDPSTGLLCIFLGGLPQIKSFESVVVSAMIMGGSSGSAVLNNKGELAGVVFAGQGKGLSYAFIVPWNYVSIFINEESSNTDIQRITLLPLPKTDEEKEENSAQSKYKKLKKECKKDSKDAKLDSVCSILEKDLIWELNP
jgi:hypothetical protein